MRGITGMAFSALALIAGAIMRYAVTEDGHGLNVSEVGTTLMIAVAIGFVVSTVLFLMTRRQPGGQMRDRQTVDAQGGTTAVHEVR